MTTTAAEVLYECPRCSRPGAWTDGLVAAEGDPLDEFWCQTCGAETPLANCRRIDPEPETWGGLVVGGPEHCAYCAAVPGLPCALHRDRP